MQGRMMASTIWKGPRIMRRARWTRTLASLLLALFVLMGASGCSALDLTGVGKITDGLRFGDGTTTSDRQIVGSMEIPAGGIGARIGEAQYQWYMDGNKTEGKPSVASCASQPGRLDCSYAHTRSEAEQEFRSHPASQCKALEHTTQDWSPDPGKWEWRDYSNRKGVNKVGCFKERELSWLEATLWNMYKTQSNETISWLTTKRDTMTADGAKLDTLKRHDTPQYDGFLGVLNRYLPVLEGVLAVCAAVSLIVVGVRVVSNTREGLLGEDHRLLDKAGWVFVGIFMSSSCVSIALAVFKLSGSDPALRSWTPGQAGDHYYLSDWVRMQVDPFFIIAAVLGVFVAGYRLVTSQEGRDLVPLGKAMMWAIVTAVCLAGAVNLLTGTVDAWTSGVLDNASRMMKDAWDHNSIAASEFFHLDPLLAVLMTVVLWICNLVGKIFTYLRAGILPILVGVAPVFAAMSWNEQGKQSFARVMGWLVAFLLYKPVAALTMATGAAIMVTAGANDDSQVITLTLTIMVVVMLPAMVKTIVPAVAGSVSGGSVMPAALGTFAGAAGGLAGGAVRHAPGGARRLAGAIGHGIGGIKDRMGGMPDGARHAAKHAGHPSGGVSSPMRGSPSSHSPDGTAASSVATENPVGAEGVAAAGSRAGGSASRTASVASSARAASGAVNPADTAVTLEAPAGADRNSTRRSGGQQQGGVRSNGF